MVSLKGLKPMYLIILGLFLYINWERKMFPVWLLKSLWPPTVLAFLYKFANIQTSFEFKILCPGQILSPQYRKSTDKQEQLQNRGHQHSQGL